MIKRIFIIFLVVVILPCLSFSTDPFKINTKVLETVVIDAGHGGKDPGSSNGGEKEKDIALSVALKLGKNIEEKFNDIKVIYTRKTDVFLELYERSRIANQSEANLFISIHCNSWETSDPYGTETYIMGLHKTDYNLGVAKKENASILMEEDYTAHYHNFDPNLPESYIALSLTQDAYNYQSEIFAQFVQEEFIELNRNSRGVKQAGFVVLSRTFMPRVLIELGFITNIEEEQYLSSDKGKEELAQAIFNAFSSYKNKYENKPLLDEKEKKNDKCKGVNYKIQLKVSVNRILLSDQIFSHLNNVSEYKINEFYKYTCGCYKSISDAEIARVNITTYGFPDAFIVAFKNDEKISIQEATLLLKN